MQRSHALLLLAAISCRRAPPDELVYTGKTAEPPPPIGPFDASLPPDDGGTQVEFTKALLLAAIAECAIDRYRAFETSAAELQQAVIQHADDELNGHVELARTAWRTTSAVWQEAELFRFGPAARSMAPGGQNLRDQIYSWPLLNRCKIEEQLVSQAYRDPNFDRTLISARGLGALEYLLFYEGTDNACSEFSPINGNGTWAALSVEELKDRKREYARAVAGDVLARARALAAAWDPAGGDFARLLVEPGALFPIDQDALNAVNEALFYLEIEVKDLKLGRPLGLVDCFETSCPDAFEGRWSLSSKVHVQANLIGFRRLFEGCGENGAGIGFDDWLGAVGAGEVALRMRNGIAASLSALDALDQPFEVMLPIDPDRLFAVHAAVKLVTDPLKTEFVTVLDLELPMTVEGDND